ncbi:restriction endonuclease subunit S [Globicatella sanguinis]
MAWEQRKLKEISDKVIKKNIEKKYTETFTNSAEFGIISQMDFFDKNISNLQNINKYYIVEHNDFVYNPRISNFAPVGPINRNKLNKVGIMSPLYYIFRTKGIDFAFLEFYFKTSIWHKFMYENGDTGARSDRFSIKDSVFENMPILTPISSEQSKIGLFFEQLHSAITLHQRNLFFPVKIFNISHIL